jgi:arsenate reductase-like glutaredoxin family protein
LINNLGVEKQVQPSSTNTVGKVIIQKISNSMQLEKSGNITILPIQISNIQMINVYNQHPNLREEVNKKIEQKYKLNYIVDTYVHPNLGVHIINKSDELLKLSSRKSDVDTILNKETSVQTSATSVTFFVKLGEFFDDLKSGKNEMFLARLIKDLCKEYNLIYEFLHEPDVYADKIILKVNSDYWGVASARIKNSLIGRVGDILANLIKSEKLDKEILLEIFKTVVLKVMKLKDYDEKYIREFFEADKNLDVLKDIRDNVEKHYTYNSSISEYLPIHKELLFVISREKEINYKGLAFIGEFQFFTYVLVDTLIRENINANTILSSDDRGGYSAIINNIFFEGLRDIKHPGRMDIIKFVAQIFDTIDYDSIHYTLSDMQTIVQRFHGVNLAELNTNKTLIKRLRNDRDRLRKELLIVNKYITMLLELDNNSQECSRFMRYFSDSNHNSNVSLRYILNGLKSKGFSFKLNNISDIISYVEKFLSDDMLNKMIVQISHTKALVTKNSKEWAELKDSLEVKSFNLIQKRLLEEPIDFTLKSTSTSISIEKVEMFLSLLKDFRNYFINDSNELKSKDFEYKKIGNNLDVKLKSASVDKSLEAIITKLSNYFEYFDSCDIRICNNIDVLQGKRTKEGEFKIGLVTLLYNIFDNNYKQLIERMKRIRNSTGYQSKINIDNFYTLVKRVVNYYKSNHTTKYPLSNKPLLLPSVEIPPTHIEVITKTMESLQEGSVEEYFGNDIENKSYDDFIEILNSFFKKHNTIDEQDRKILLTSVELYYQAKKEELIEKQNLLKDNEFKVPDRIINPHEGLKKNK